jgi:glycerophosphoryl diester phosphodiesterase
MKPFDPTPKTGTHPLLAAHRGISSKAPENTLASFTLALNTPGIDMIELDVRLTKDEQVIVLHDRTLQRTSTGNGFARKYTLDEIKRFDAGSWFNPAFGSERIPTLRSVLQLVGKSLWVNVEIKSDPFHKEPAGLLERRTLEVLEECNMKHAVIVSSFDHQLVASLKRMAPEIKVGVLYNFFRDFGRLPSKLARRVDASAFICGRQELSKAMIDDAHNHGVAVYVYTLNSVRDAQKMLRLGVDGILSDNADEIVTLVKGQPSPN